MKFSILVPVYNVEDYVDECIQSVLSQTFSDYELILVDDGSTDCSGKICDSYAEKYSQIKVYHKPNAGLIHTRRYGISKACGEWYVFLDSDDSLKTNALETINHYTDAADCVIYGYEQVLDNKIVMCAHDPKVIRICDKRQIYRKIFIEGGYNALWRKAVKSSMVGIIDFSDYYHISLGEDLLQSLEILGNCNTVTFIPDILYRYKVNPRSITQNITYENYSVDFTIRIKVLEFITNEKVFLENDHNAYRDYCLDMDLFWNLETIANFNTTLSNKKALFKHLKETKYYEGFLSKGYSKEYKKWKRRLVFKLYQMSLYHILLTVLKR